MHSAKIHFSEALVRRAVRTFWWRRTGWSYVLVLILLLVWFCFSVWNGDRSWAVGASGTIVVLGAILAATVYVTHLRRSLGVFRKMQTPEAILEFDEDRMRVSSDLGTSELKWGMITEVWCLPEFWLLFVSQGQFITLPIADIGADAREYILAKVESAGAKIG
jgi:hypothetical protein